MTRYLLAIFLSAFLLFQVQPLIGKHILPWFGGSPAVWTTCLLFFQVFLLAGYGYAHWVAGWRRREIQGLVHMLLLGGTLLFLPLVPSQAWKPEGTNGSPVWLILVLLTVTVGGPYFLLSSTSPLLQAWFATTHRGRSPYRLFALSNAGSLIGLVSYPFFFEAFLTRPVQALIWSWGYGVFVICCGWCVLRLVRPAPSSSASATVLSASAVQASGMGLVSGVDKGCRNPVPSQAGSRSLAAHQVFSWILLSGCGSVLLLATTNQMCQDVAVVPFLWVLPLTLYLVTFIIAFDREHWYKRVWCMPLLGVSIALACVVLYQDQDAAVPLKLMIPAYSAMLFAGCMTCHGELARAKPGPRYLTHFYLAVAGGGALGGIFVALAAPVLFTDYWEYHLALAGTGVVALAAIYFDPDSPISYGKRNWAWMLLILAYGVLIAALLNKVLQDKAESVASSRSFYGVLHITEGKEEGKGAYREMYHGRVSHGFQYMESPWSELPGSYYGEGTGVWVAAQYHPRRMSGDSLHIGVVGLGTGTIAALGQDGDTVRFYEINPDVTRLADRWFRYLQDTKARTEVVMGDARIQLERELSSRRPQNFDLLVADAFSGDAIPLHLLTRECAQVYRRHLKNDGILAVNISNMYLDLKPIALGMARFLGWEAILVDSEDLEEKGTYAATWVLITANRRFLDSREVESARTNWPEGVNGPGLLWTDDFASLFQVLSGNATEKPAKGKTGF